MPATVDVLVPNQGVSNSDWKEIFLGSDGNPKFFVNPHSPMEIAQNAITTLLIFASIAAIVYLIIAAWTLVSSGGDTDKYAKAKSNLINTVIGVVILFSMWALIAAIRWLAQGSIG